MQKVEIFLIIFQSLWSRYWYPKKPKIFAPEFLDGTGRRLSRLSLFPFEITYFFSGVLNVYRSEVPLKSHAKLPWVDLLLGAPRGLCIGGVLQIWSRAAGEAPGPTKETSKLIPVDPKMKAQKTCITVSWDDDSKSLHPKNDWNSPFPTIFAVEAVSFSCRVARRSTLTMTLNIDMWSFQRRVIFDLQRVLLDCGYQTIYCTCTWYTPISSYHQYINIFSYHICIYVPYVYLYKYTWTIYIYMPYTYCWWQPEIRRENHLTFYKPCKQWDI